MRKKYDVYFSAGNAQLKKSCELYSDNDNEIVKTVIKMLTNIKNGYSDINVEFIVKQGDRQVLHFAA